MNQFKIGIITGSLSKKSYSKYLADSFIKLSPEYFSIDIININNLQMYNGDLDVEGQIPKEWIEFRNTIASYDGFIFITPEYNRSIPAVLKNALDIASRPYGNSAWDKKPAMVASISPGALGGYGANHHLRQILTCLNVPTMQHPEIYISDIYSLFDENGELINDSTNEFLKLIIESFKEWVKRFV